MADAFALFADISPTIKLGWIVFVAWSGAQIVWYQRTRLAPVPVKPARRRKSASSVRRPAARPARSESSDSTELLTSLGLLQSPGATQYGVPMSSGSHSGSNVIS